MTLTPYNRHAYHFFYKRRCVDDLVKEKHAQKSLFRKLKSRFFGGNLVNWMFYMTMLYVERSECQKSLLS